MTVWRWDQGRLEYFMFDNMKEIAKSLATIDGVNLSQTGIDPLRAVLTADTGLPFSPSHYTVWRNYARVLGCSLLATRAGNTLIITKTCQAIATGAIREADEYLAVLVQRFRYPSPVFESYDPKEKIVLPFMAILKLLAARGANDAFPNISLEDVFSLLIGNNCSGLEDESFYRQLKPTSCQPLGDQKRQVREMMLVLSQFSFLKWTDKRLFFDNSFDLKAYLQELHPATHQTNTNRLDEFLNLCGTIDAPPTDYLTPGVEMPSDLIFTEGKRSRVTHLKIERSPLLRKMYFEKNRHIQCNMCELQPRLKYPWTDNILEIHHLLPLSSALVVSQAGTSLEDIVSLCPNCHRSVHIFYKKWFEQTNRIDFNGRPEAKEVYLEAKKAIAV